jgi:hypothetical protein
VSHLALVGAVQRQRAKLAQELVPRRALVRSEECEARDLVPTEPL